MKYLPLLILIACRDPSTLKAVPPPPPCEPVAELCDGADNDCDNVIDQYAVPCSTACGDGIEYCSRGKWTGCSAKQPRAETCNGKDDDCDQLIDEPGDLTVAPCYPGNPDELRFGSCRFGLTRCTAGEVTCSGAITPQAEQCNGVDDDCDGESDEGFSTSMDLVFIVDNSGSMQTVIQNIQRATISFASKYAGRADIRWAIVGAPGPRTQDPAKPTVLLQFSDPAAFSSVMLQQDGVSGAALEPTLDAIDQVASNTLGLYFESENKAIIVLSDEDPQSYATPLVTVLNLRGASLHVFTSAYAWTRWAAFGSVHDIGLMPAPFVVELEEVITEGVCK